MVVAGAAVTPAFAIDSVIRAAAFPVGAAKARRKPGFVSCRYFTARAIVCVFPVPPDPFGHVPLVLPVPARIQQIPAHHERRRHVLDRRPPVDNANHFRHFRKQPHLLFVKAAADVSLLQVGDGRSANLGNLRVSAGHPFHHVPHCILHLVNPPIPMRRKACRATPLPGGRRTPLSRR